MRTRSAMLNELRNSLVREGLRAKMTKAKAEEYATVEIRRNADTLDKPAMLRRAVRGCRLLARTR